jgi:hypothetical protein
MRLPSLARASAGGVIASFLLNACATPATGPSPALPAAPSAARLAGDRQQAPAATITLQATSSGPTVSADAYGASIATWYDYTQSHVAPSLAHTGLHLVRYPGGSESDAYHWANGGTVCSDQGYIASNATFDNLVSAIVAPLKIHTAVTLNYGSNPACNGGGDPTEAAAWVAYSKAHGEHVQYWTVGNEVYGSWEYDLHAKPHDPATYAQAVKTGYYPDVKSADAAAKLGIVVDTPDDTAWNNVVLRQAKPYDFVELHYYPQYNSDSDAFLLGAAVDNFAKDLSGLRAQMTAAGVAKTLPIYVGEFNNDAGNEGKQSVSIVNGLFLGQMLGTMLKAGVPMATWWLAYGSCDETGDYSSSLYGFQKFGSEALFSDGLPNVYESCAGTPSIPAGTPFPPARVLTAFRELAPAGAHVRTVAVPSSLGTAVRAYGFSIGKDGYGFAIFNNTLSAVKVVATVKGAGKKTFDATQTTYGTPQYDASKQNHWLPPATTSLGTVSSSIALTLAPYSFTALRLR